MDPAAGGTDEEPADDTVDATRVSRRRRPAEVDSPASVDPAASVDAPAEEVPPASAPVTSYPARRPEPFRATRAAPPRVPASVPVAPVDVGAIARETRRRARRRLAALVTAVVAVIAIAVALIVVLSSLG